MRRGILPAGTRVGPYEIRLQIGSGGMGVVYEAESPDGSSVALKLLHPDQLGKPVVVRKFRDEAVAGLVVTHPNVVSTFARGETAEGIPFLVMERARGELLGARIRRCVPSLRRSVDIACQILEGVNALHAADIVHGDVKSDNVLVEAQDDGRDRARLFDLGLAHVQLPNEETADISGTPEYMAPEVVEGHGSTVASDLYGVGIVLYELITGSTPFAGGTVAEILRRHATDPVVPPSLRRLSTPAILDRIVLHALAKDPAQRFASAKAFLSALHVAMPLLDDAEDRRSKPTFSREAKTQDWAIHRTGPRSIARGTPAHR